MLEKSFTDIYMKFKVHFYQEVFQRMKNKEATLSTIELFCVEMIHAMNEPTVNEFAKSIQVSSPNAAYKVNCLIKKGYIEKVQSTKDKREYHLKVTPLYYEHYNLSQNYLSQVVERAVEHFSKEDLEKVDKVLHEITDALMPEAMTVPSEKNND